MLSKGPTQFDQEANKQAQSQWHCPKCNTETTMKFSDLADIVLYSPIGAMANFTIIMLMPRILTEPT